MGPILCQLSCLVYTTVQWYAVVRSTELRGGGTRFGTKCVWRSYLFAHLVSPWRNSVLVVGGPGDNPLVRVHSNCLTGDVWFGRPRPRLSQRQRLIVLVKRQVAAI